MGSLEIFLSLTSFLNSALMFWAEPMMAKRVLPILGGSPAVWNTCVVFFQAALLLGYGLTRMAGTRRGRFVPAAALLLLASIGAALPAPGQTLVASPEAAQAPIRWLLETLLAQIGVPFLVLSATGPMLATWLARTSRRSASDPYFLYAAGALGSFTGLLAYPTVIEPELGLASQLRLWHCGYLLLLALLMIGAVLCIGQPRSAPVASEDTSAQPWLRCLHWGVLAFLPSSLMLGVTTYITTDIAPLPLLWVLPLALYLLTQYIAFSGRTRIAQAAVALTDTPLIARPVSPWLLAILFLPVVFLALRAVTDAPLGLVCVQLLTFFAAALLCHRSLAALRPPAHQLREFYLWMGIGGVIGGIFNALVAPILFRNALEYPLILVLVATVRTPRKRGPATVAGDLAWAALIGLGAAMLALIPRLGYWPVLWHPRLLLVVPVLASLAATQRPMLQGLGLAATVLASTLYPDVMGRTLLAKRTFFGIYRVLDDPVTRIRAMYDGTTLHGAQSLDPAKADEPLAYYHPSGPLGLVFAALSSRLDRARIAVVGLGTGCMITYAHPGQRWTFYEIDPEVVYIARDSGLFTYLSRCKVPLDIALGDARLTLVRAGPGLYDLLVLDAFSSDAIPMHLLTREALALYRSHLAPGGTIVIHTSNRYLNLVPAIGDLAADSGLRAWSRVEEVTPPEYAIGKRSSQWMVLTRDAYAIQELSSLPWWEPVSARPGARAWTDDYSDIYSALVVGMNPVDP